MKKRYLALLLIFTTLNTFGQSNFYRLSVGGGAGATYSFTDVKKGKVSFGGMFNFDYHFTPFVTAGLEVQGGVLEGGENGRSTPDDNGRAFKNNYLAFNTNVKFRAGEVTDFYYNEFLNYTKGFYLGAGLGVINNQVDNIKSKTTKDAQGNQRIYEFPGKNKGLNFYVPINVGIDFYFPDGWGDIRYTLNVNYQANVTFGEGLDGYDDTLTIRKELGSAPDIYNIFSVGFKYSFGPKGLTAKNFR